MNNINVETSRVFNFATTRSSSKCKFSLRHFRDRLFERLETNLKNLLSRALLSNWFSTIFWIFIGLFTYLLIFICFLSMKLVSIRLSFVSTRFLVVSTRFYLFASRLYPFLSVYHSFLVLVITSLDLPLLLQNFKSFSKC